jgi:hypothetical protein
MCNSSILNNRHHEKMKIQNSRHDCACQNPCVVTYKQKKEEIDVEKVFNVYIYGGE